ncbi:hypothetical protein K503DRAFT_770968 [Rhizopogon vinicolor AM-OR11-026]|uniref:Uncharacterized protein n=1 Tax=Rhizopogon vinicolor AM-OR11-026 TaxID=1314800 RepID=A0A1B7MZH2_9AGAM|nr:hypothetical protein K503DRAFT_770968 [Rhizopogon vinicolor AM-OR11-026]
MLSKRPTRQSVRLSQWAAGHHACPRGHVPSVDYSAGCHPPSRSKEVLCRHSCNCTATHVRSPPVLRNDINFNHTNGTQTPSQTRHCRRLLLLDMLRRILSCILRFWMQSCVSGSNFSVSSGNQYC